MVRMGSIYNVITLDDIYRKYKKYEYMKIQFGEFCDIHKRIGFTII